MRRIALFGTVLMSLSLGACGGEVALEPESPLVETSQEILDPPKCTTTQDFIIRYYSLGTLVGSDTCTCGRLTRQGQDTRSLQQTFFPYCSI